MKQTTLILIITIGLFGCSNQPKQVSETAVANSNNYISKIDNSKFYTQEDTIFIANEKGYTLKYSKTEFNSIVDSHSEFFKKYPNNPDQTFLNVNFQKEFCSEADQDNYYALYAYFLKQKNGNEEFAQQRQTLIDIYSNINTLFGQLEHGGTYFGHQSKRILAYAEYAIYLLPKSKAEIHKTYNITKQKELYLKSLRQLIEDESKIDFEILGKEKTIRNQTLNEIVDKLGKLITNNFYLIQAQEFQYAHYKYH